MCVCVCMWCRAFTGAAKRKHNVEIRIVNEDEISFLNISFTSKK